MFNNKYYKNFITCSICYNNCHDNVKLQCAFCEKYYHQSCVNISKRTFRHIKGSGVNGAICCNKCCMPFLPFYSISDKAFLDVNVGKRKLPCKKCYRECFKKKNCKKCYVCAKSFHQECLPKKCLTSEICSKVCEMKLLPFSKLNDHELCDEITPM